VQDSSTWKQVRISQVLITPAAALFAMQSSLEQPVFTQSASAVHSPSVSVPSTRSRQPSYSDLRIEGAPAKPLPLPVAAATGSRSTGTASGTAATVDGRCTHAVASKIQSVREWTNIVPPARGLTRLPTPVGSGVHVGP
jgi:hypothetical protein